MATRKLVISFTGLVFAIHFGVVTEEDLENALFYLGCTRTHAYDPDANSAVNELVMVIGDDQPDAAAQRLKIHQIIVKALEKAEEEKRVLYRERSEDNSIKKLSQLLEANGIEPWRCFMMKGYFSAATGNDVFGPGQYSYVVEAINDAGIPVDVVWR